MGQELSTNELSRERVHDNSPSTSQDDFKKLFIYILRLTDGKYYVGKSRNLLRRFSDHHSGIGSQWTIKYKPIFIEDVFESTGQFDEDNCVKKLMMKYGVDNVRGGAYSNIVLSGDQIDLLEKEFRSATDGCFRCGGSGHFARNCPNLSNKILPDKPSKIVTKEDLLPDKPKNNKIVKKHSQSDKVKSMKKDALVHSVSAPKDIVSNHGCKWTAEADRSLIADYHRGVTIHGLAIKYGRTEGAIVGRLDKLEVSDSSD